MKTANEMREPIVSFSTGGHTVYHLKPATVMENGRRGVVSAAYDGYVLCHSQEGRLLWAAQPSAAFPFSLAVADLDGDGLDESLIAYSDGHLYALDHDGRLLWSALGGPPLYQVATTEGFPGPTRILAGGIERIAHVLSANGETLSRYQADGAIRLLGVGNFAGDGQAYVAMAARHLRLLRFPGFETVWDEPKRYVYSMAIFDIDGDGRDEIVLGGNRRFSVHDYDGNARTHNTESKKKPRPYKMDFFDHIKSESLQDEYILNLSGRDLLQLDRSGACRNIFRGPYSFASAAFDPLTNIYWLGSGISGGDDIHGLRLDMPGWEARFIDMKPVGRMAVMERNMAALLRQTESFRPPEYQKAPPQTLVVIEESPEWEFERSWSEVRARYVEPYALKNVWFAPYVYSHESFHHFKEGYDPGIADTAMRAQWERAHHMTGDMNDKPREEILEFCRLREEAGEPFFIYAGHGREFGIDFYISPRTLAEMLAAAPRTLQGFVFAELEHTDDLLEKAIREQLLPLADLCYEHGKKKIILRNKNIFWNGNIHLDLFRPIMADERYREIFVPSMEETNSRSQSLSLAGRAGLWLTGRFRHMSGRVVTDNANYNRLWEWCQVEHLSHFLRALSLKRALGADLFHINITSDNASELLPFYLMLEKGILPLPGREDIVSLCDTTIGIKSPDAEFIAHGTNGHGLDRYQPQEETFVFDRLDCYWGGAPIPDHDLERYAMNARRRMTNFIAQSPFGNMTTISAETDLAQFPFFRRMLVTDGKYWYDETGNARTAEEYKPEVLRALEDSAARLPIRVFGEVAWAAIRLDSSHIRLILIDPGYMDPADRNAEAVFQHIRPARITDILSGETLELEQGRLRVHVPMGILRILDIEH